MQFKKLEIKIIKIGNNVIKKIKYGKIIGKVKIGKWKCYKIE